VVCHVLNILHISLQEGKELKVFFITKRSNFNRGFSKETSLLKRRLRGTYKNSITLPKEINTENFHFLENSG